MSDERKPSDATLDGSQFVPSEFGKALRRTRELKYPNAADFAQAIIDTTGYKWAKDKDTFAQTIRALERGKQNPSVSFLVAASITLFGHFWLHGMNRLICSGMPNEFLAAVEHENNRAKSFFEDAESRGHDVLEMERIAVDYSATILKRAREERMGL